MSVEVTVRTVYPHGLHGKRMRGKSKSFTVDGELTETFNKVKALLCGVESTLLQRPPEPR